MRTFRVRLEAIASPSPLLTAWLAYRSGKRRRPAVAAFELDAERRLLEISERLLSGTWRPGSYTLLEIHDPKRRLIAVASVADRVVHRAVHDTLAPLFNRSFLASSYACLEGRGSHRAVWRFAERMRRHRHFVHLDIASYFPSVDHQILLNLLGPRLRDSRVVHLLERIVESGAPLYRDPRMRSIYPAPQDGRPCGLPIGNLTSQWWGNLYLDRLDHFIQRELKADLIRYMDDLVLFADDPSRLRRHRREVADWLHENRRLKLNPRKGHIRPTRLPYTYLGYRVSRTGWDLGPKALRRFRKQLRTLRGAEPEEVERRLAGWRGAMMV